MKERSRNRRFSHAARGGAYVRQRMRDGGFKQLPTLAVAAVTCPHCGEVLFVNGARIHDPLNCAMNGGASFASPQPTKP